jgi:FAD/FMN-containing dehydrogenase
LKADIVPHGLGVVVASFADQETAQDVSEVIIDKLKPTFLESFDGALFEQARMMGKSYDFLKEAGFDVSSVLLIGFEDSGGRARSKNIKKTLKLLKAVEAWTTVGDGASAEELLSLRDALVWASSPDKVEFGPSSPLGGAYIPPDSVSVFRSEAKTLAKKHGVTLPVYGQDLQNVYYVLPNLSMKKSGDKQKMLKLLDEYSRMVQKLSGELVGSGAEGRLRSRFALGTFDDDTLKLFSDIKAAFDPHKILNPGVKEMLELKQLVPMIQSDESFPSLPNYVPRV